jgi:hypothetical protein
MMWALPDGRPLPANRTRRNSSGASGTRRVSITSGNIVTIVRRRDDDRRYFGGIEKRSTPALVNLTLVDTTENDQAVNTPPQEPS